jgi:hypothetical protein
LPGIGLFDWGANDDDKGARFSLSAEKWWGRGGLATTNDKFTLFASTPLLSLDWRANDDDKGAQASEK